MPTKIKEEALLHSDKDLTTWHKKMKIWQDTRRYSTSEDELTYANTWMNSTENNPSNLSKDVLVDFTLILRSRHWDSNSFEIFSSYTYAIYIWNSYVGSVSSYHIHIACQPSRATTIPIGLLSLYGVIKTQHRSFLCSNIRQ